MIISYVDEVNLPDKYKNDHKASYIFRDKKGHIKVDTQEERKLLEDIANGSENKLETDKYGNY